MSSCKIVGIGAVVADSLTTLSHYPEQDSKLRADGIRMTGGGPVGTGIVAAAKLGVSCGYIGVLAQDAGGSFLYDDFIKYGVSVENVDRLSGYRSFSSQIWLSQESGSRTVVYDKGDLPPLQLDDKKREAIKNAELLMLDANELSAALEAAEYARRQGTTVLLDCDTIYEGMMSLLEYVDILIPSVRFARTVTGEQDPKSAAALLHQKYSPRVTVVTCGSEGGVLFDDDGAYSYPVYPARVVDSNGAGDVFHGAFAAGLIKGFSYRDCCHFASAVSAIKCTGTGARESVPDFDTTIKFLKENGYEL